MRTRSRWATQEAVVGIVLILMAAVLLALSLQSGWAGPALASPAPPSSAGPAPAAVTQPTTGSATPATVTAAPSAKATTNRKGVTGGASTRPSTPLLLEVPAIALKAGITAYTPAQVAAQGGAVKPPTLFSVSWWTGGGDPGPEAGNTVYLYGHTWKEPAVFNRIKELRAGDRVVVTTTSGRLVYVVDGSFTVDKPDLVSNARVTQALPGRLLLIGCYRATGHETHTTANIVVTTHLLA